MNTDTDNRNGSADIFAEENSPRNYRPQLKFYHANSKGSGSAARFEVVPATGERDGAIFLTLANQKSVAGEVDERGRRQYATFDWQNRVTVKLNFSDICQMLMVFRGEVAAVADGKGLYHDTREMSTIINLAKQAEPYSGFALGVSRRNKADPDTGSRVRILFNSAESLGLSVVLEQSLGVIAFGIPS